MKAKIIADIMATFELVHLLNFTGKIKPKITPNTATIIKSRKVKGLYQVKYAYKNENAKPKGIKRIENKIMWGILLDLLLLYLKDS